MGAMGSRKVIKYQADVIDSMRSDWNISDDGYDRGPIDQWPAPFLDVDDGSNRVTPKNLRRAGSRSGMRFDESSGPIPPQILPRKRDQDFDDGGLWESDPYTRDNAFRDLRYEEAIFSRTHLSDNTPRPATPGNAPGGGDAYKFLRVYDPGSDNTYAPRWRSGRQTISTSAVNAGAGYMYEFTGDPVSDKGQQRRGYSGVVSYSDAGDIYADIQTMHGETVNQIVNQFKVPMTQAEHLQLQDRFQQLQRVAKQPAWYPKGVADIHKVTYQILNRHYKGKVPPEQAQALNQNMIRIGANISAGQPPGILGAIVSVVEGVASAITSIPVLGTLVSASASAITSPARLVVDIATGKNLLESVTDKIKRDIQTAREVAPYAQAVLTLVPGVGTGISAALGAGLALANGQSITQALLAGVKSSLPGGPLAAAAFDTAINLAQGKSVPEALLAAARERIPGGPAAKAAFDVAVAMAHGQNIQKAVIESGSKLLPGGETVQSAARKIASGENVAKTVLQAGIQAGVNVLPGGKTVQSVARNIASGQNVAQSVLQGGIQAARDKAMAVMSPRLSPNAIGPMSSVGPAIGRVVQTGMSVLPQGVKSAAQAILANPSLRSLPIQDLARKLNVSTNDARDAVASVVQAAQRAGNGARPMALAQAPAIAERIGTHTSFDDSLARFGSRMAPIAFGPSSSAARSPARIAPPPSLLTGTTRILPRIPSLMPGAVNVTSPPKMALTLNRMLGARGVHDAGYGLSGYMDAGAFGTIRLGSTGPDVVSWQKIIGVKADGKFGPQTDAATRAWQRSKGLTADGIVGPLTWEKATGWKDSVAVTPLPGPGPTSSTHVTTLPEVVIAAKPPPPLTQGQTTAINDAPTLRLGSTGHVVTTWQGILKRDSGISGFTIMPDGVFGPITDKATRNWQTNSGLQADGIVGPQTWKKAIGSLTTPPLPAEIAPGVPMKTPVPQGLPPGLPPVPTEPVRTVPPQNVPPVPPPANVPPIYVPPGGPPSKPSNALPIAALALVAAKMGGLF